jgi:hypothetical protein
VRFYVVKGNLVLSPGSNYEVSSTRHLADGISIHQYLGGGICFGGTFEMEDWGYNGHTVYLEEVALVLAPFALRPIGPGVLMVLGSRNHVQKNCLNR